MMHYTTRRDVTGIAINEQYRSVSHGMHVRPMNRSAWSSHEFKLTNVHVNYTA